MRTLTILSDQVYYGELILVNSLYPYRAKNQEYWLTSVSNDFNDILLNKRVCTKLNDAMVKLGCLNEIVPVSGYRTLSEQSEIYEDCLRNEGVGYTTDFVAFPGCSEHHTGLAIDLGENCGDIDFICPKFPYDGICQEFRNIAAQYGFIERYQQGKELITKVAKEPWHFRYVGYPHGQIITDKNYTLEEYINYIRMFPKDGNHLYFSDDNREYEILFMSMNDVSDIKLSLSEDKHCQISGNNVDGIIVTLW